MLLNTGKFCLNLTENVLGENHQRYIAQRVPAIVPEVTPCTQYQLLFSSTSAKINPIIMATAVPSRFAVLSIEDDDNKPKKATKPAIAGKTTTKNNKNEKLKQQPKKDDKKKSNNNKVRRIVFP